MMRTYGWVVPALLAVLAASAAPAPAGELVEVRSKRYTLRTDLSDRAEVRQVLGFLEAMHKTYEDVFRGDPVREVPRPMVRVLARQEDYLVYGGADTQVHFNRNSRGYYARDRNELVTYRGESLPDLFEILSHEGFHQFAWAHIVPPNADPLPSWYEEGLADFFRSSALDGARLERQFHRGYADLVQRAIREGWVWTQEQLWGCDPSRLEEQARFDAYYAHTYVLMRYLVQEQRAAVLEVCRRKRAGAPTARILEAVFPPGQRGRLHEALLAFARDPR